MKHFRLDRLMPPQWAGELHADHQDCMRLRARARVACYMFGCMRGHCVHLCITISFLRVVLLVVRFVVLLIVALALFVCCDSFEQLG
jgi:hypothetical protein